DGVHLTQECYSLLTRTTALQIKSTLDTMAPRYPPLTPLPDIIQPNNPINSIVQQLMELQPYHPHPTPYQLAIPGPSTAQISPSNHTSRPLQAARALKYNTTTNFPIINFIK
ncbi:unnamed protein product, partial [Meganyctiphanes norvegica]